MSGVNIILLNVKTSKKNSSFKFKKKKLFSHNNGMELYNFNFVSCLLTDYKKRWFYNLFDFLNVFYVLV